MTVQMNRWIGGVVMLAAMGLVGGCFSAGGDDDDAPPVIVLDNDTGGGGGGGDDAGMPTDTGGGQSCNAGLEKCGGTCVNVSNNASHCGQCGNSCGDQPCDNGQCVTQPEDCTQPGESCRGFTYCDLGSGECKPGCGSDEQCGPNSSCDIGSRDCSCDEGFHDCNGQCVSDSSPNSCGSRCTPCPSDPNGSATCAAGSCGLSCQNGYRNCGGQCASCPSTGPGATTTCNGSQCVVACQSGYLSCSKGCCPSQIERLDQGPTTDNRVYDIAVDGQGNPHLAYLSEPTNGNADPVIRYATKQGGSWSQETLSDTDGNRINPDDFSVLEIVVDGSGKATILYEGTFDDYLAVQTSNGWERRNVDNRIGGVLQLGIDSTGNYRALTVKSSDYQYATWDGSQWNLEVMEPNVELRYSRMGFGAAGQPHFVGLDTDNGVIYYGTRSGGTWSFEPVAKTVIQSPRPPYIAVDGNNQPHVLYVDKSDDTIYDVTKQGGQWKRTALKSDPQGSRYRDMRLTPGVTSGPMTLAYTYDQTLHFGRRTQGKWTFTDVGALGDVRGDETEYVVAPNGDPHFVWTRSSEKLQYAH